MPDTLAAEPRRVFVTGAFDMNNYGNLLFPLIAAFRLEPHRIGVVPVCPTGRRPPIGDAMACVDVAHMMGADDPLHGILIGGGNTFHDQAMTFMEDYRDADMERWASTGLWIGATLAAGLRDVPALWNAPGVPVPIAHPKRRAVVAAALRAASYVSVRDDGSAQTLQAPADVEVAVVPDTVADLARMWPATTLERPFGDLMARKGGDPAARHLAFHVRARAMGMPPGELASLLDGFAGAQGLVPILIAVGPGLGDGETLRTLSQQMRARHVLLDDPLSLQEIAAAIAHAQAYVGSSLHAYITSASYGVPAVVVARPARRKFGGFLAHVDRPQDLAREWADAFDTAAAHLAAGARRPVPERVLQELDAHWARIRAALADPAPKRRERMDFLRAYLRFGADANGPVWALRPFLTHAGRAELAAGQTAAAPAS